MKKTKKSLVLCGIAIMLCVALMAGTTYAWFVMSVTSESNTVNTAGYNVTIQYSDAYNGTYSDLTTTAIFNDTLKPGENSDVKYIKITNNNDYAVTADLTVGNATVTESGAKLSLGYKTVTAAAAYADLTKADFDTITATLSVLNRTTIAANSSVVVAMATGLATDATIPGVTATFSITVVAEQSHS